MEIMATMKYARLSAQKCRLLCDLIRGKTIENAIDILSFSVKQKPASILKKVLISAVANAEHNYGADVDNLKIKTVFANQGSAFKRMHARAKGRGCRILKPTCHVTVVVSDEGGY